MTATNEQAKTICDMEFDDYRAALLANLQEQILHYMKVAGPGEIRIICGEYEAVIKRSEA